MTARGYSDVTARRLAALFFALLLSAQPVVLCCSARAATALDAGYPSTRHHDGAAHDRAAHDRATRHDAAAHDTAAPSLGAACTAYVAVSPAMRERSPDTNRLCAPSSSTGLPLPTATSIDAGRLGIALQPIVCRTATPLRL